MRPGPAPHRAPRTGHRAYISNNFTSDSEIRTPPTIPINHYLRQNRGQGAESKEPGAGSREQSAGHTAKSKERREQRAQSTEHRAQNTEHRAHSTELRAQSTAHSAQRTAKPTLPCRSRESFCLFYRFLFLLIVVFL